MKLSAIGLKVFKVGNYSLKSVLKNLNSGISRPEKNLSQPGLDLRTLGDRENKALKYITGLRGIESAPVVSG